jgi:hypothetical protein
MDRRAFLAAGSAGLTLLAGCYSGGSDDRWYGEGGTETPTAQGTPTPSPTTTIFAITVAGVSETTDGTLRVTLDVTNERSSERTRTLAVDVSVDGETYTQTTSVTVPAGETVEATVTFDEVTREEFGDGGSLSVEVE